MKTKLTKKNKGRIEVICGSMFSGKTEELLKRLNNSKTSEKKIIVFKPSIDIRYDKNNVVSHNKNKINCISVKEAKEILDFIEDHEVIAIDEAQFFDKNIIKICKELANKGKRVILSGLDMDYLGNPFGSMPQLLSIAEDILKLHAICEICGDKANHSYKKNNTNLIVEVGEKNIYKALCRNCFLNENLKS